MPHEVEDFGATARVDIAITRTAVPVTLVTSLATLMPAKGVQGGRPTRPTSGLIGSAASPTQAKLVVSD